MPVKCASRVLACLAIAFNCVGIALTVSAMSSPWNTLDVTVFGRSFVAAQLGVKDVTFNPNGAFGEAPITWTWDQFDDLACGGHHRSPFNVSSVALCDNADATQVMFEIVYPMLIACASVACVTVCLTALAWLLPMREAWRVNMGWAAAITGKFPGIVSFSAFFLVFGVGDDTLLSAHSSSAEVSYSTSLGTGQEEIIAAIVMAALSVMTNIFIAMWLQAKPRNRGYGMMGVAVGDPQTGIQTGAGYVGQQPAPYQAPQAQPHAQQQPAYGQPPAYGQQPPAYGQQPPAYGQQPPYAQPVHDGVPPAYAPAPGPGPADGYAKY